MIETIEADSKAEAMVRIKIAYENGKIMLSETNAYIDVNFNFV